MWMGSKWGEWVMNVFIAVIMFLYCVDSGYCLLQQMWDAYMHSDQSSRAVY